jgi:hypothetical protein
MMAAPARPGALGILALEETEAWAEYLEATQDQPDCRYEELEPWAWSRLGRRLSQIQSRRNAIESEGGG